MDFNLASNYLFLFGAAVWLVTAFKTKRTIRMERSGNRLLYLFIIIIVVLLSRAEFGDVIHKRIIPYSYSSAMAGLIITAAGIFFAVWARLMLGSNWSGRITLKEDHQLITTGPYAITRNPIYSGVLLAVVGKTIIGGEVRNITMLVLLTIALLVKINHEEKLLSGHFGTVYAEYLRSTKKLIPFIF